MSTSEWVHIPVLARDVVENLSSVKPLQRMIDGTLGNGGHTRLMLEKNPQLHVLGIDRDTAALERATANLAEFGDRFTAVHGEFLAAHQVQVIGADHQAGVLAA